MQPVRRVDLLWQGEEVNQYEKLKNDARSRGRTIPEFVKAIIERAINRNLVGN